MTGTLGLLRFMLRRERRGLPWWLVGVALLWLIQSGQSQNLYGTPEDLAELRSTAEGNTAVVVMSGPIRLLDSIGGEIVFEMFAFTAVVLALMNIFLVGRQTRADEETGRAELLRSGRVGRRAPLAAALALAGIADVVAGLVVCAVVAGTGLPLGSSVLLGAATAVVAATFAALTAVMAQLFESARSVYGSAAVLLGAAFALRAAGDAGSGVLSWLSPIGWGQRTYPYVADRWWPLLVALAAIGLLTAIAVVLLDRRDFGHGLVAPRSGRPVASAAFGNAYGLAWRLQRGALIGWLAGLALLGLAYGSMGDSMQQYVDDHPEIAQYLPGGAARVLDSYLALTVGLSALIAAAYGVSSVLRARSEETSGHAESVLATRTSRLSWLAGQLSVTLAGTALALVAIGLGEGAAYALSVSDAAQVPRLVGVALAYLPAVWAVAAVGVLALGWLPRAAAAVGWTVVGYCAIVSLFGDSFDLPGWSRAASPFDHTPQVPLDALDAAPLVVLTLIVVALLGAGYAGLRRRDIGY